VKMQRADASRRPRFATSRHPFAGCIGGP
jgi:hypothetical protein